MSEVEEASVRAGYEVVPLTPAIRLQQITHVGHFTVEQVNLIRDTVARGATPDELKLFIAICGRTGLDPFTRQIHFVKRWDSKLGREVGAVQTGIDGYRLTAQRSEEYDGQDPKMWCGDDGVWREVWLEAYSPSAARAIVYRKGINRPFVAVARFSAYAPRNRKGELPPMWEKMDAEQLAKCAEVLALRMAFPNELSDIYADEEMEQAVSTATLVSPEVVTGTGMAGLKSALAPTESDTPPEAEATPPADPSEPITPIAPIDAPPVVPSASEGPAEPSEAESTDEGSPLFPVPRRGRK